MREIKFRAWDIPNKKMIPNVMIFGHSMGVSVTIPHGDYATGKHWRHDDFGNMYCDNNKVIPLQYAGLHDKNGVEIYEGDILKREVGHIDHWDEGQPVFVKEWKNSAVVYRAPGFKMDSSITTDWINEKEVEVIGNIYDNPELLKSEA